MAQQYKTGLIITGDASGGIRAIRATDEQLARLNQGFDQGSRRSRQFNQDVNATSQGLTVLKRAAAPIAGAIAGMFAANTLQNQIDWGDQLQKTNLRIGASTEALSQYNYVAKLSGVEFGQLTTAWQRQTRRIAEAAAGTGVASKALDRLGLSAQALNQLAPEEQFERIATAMQNVESSSERVALAQKLWDSEGVKLVQIVNQGTDAIASMRAEADALGLTISQDTANAMATYNDEVDRLKFAAQGLSQTLATELVPSITAGLQTTNAFIQEIGGAETILTTAKDAATVLAAIMAGRYAAAFAASAKKVAINTTATIAQARADVTATSAARVKAAETLRVAVSEQAAAKRAYENARATAAATGNTTLRTKAITQLAAANQRAIGAEAAHTAAVNANSAAMGRATVSAYAMAAAARAGSAALALVGGPMGAAVIAGAATYYFRDALGFASAEARKTSQEVDQLIDSLDTLTNAQFENKRQKYWQDWQDARIEAERLQGQIESLRDASNMEIAHFQGAGAGRATQQISELTAEMWEQSRVADANRESYEKLGDSWDELMQSQVSGASIYRTLGQWLFDTGESASGASTQFDALNYTLGTGGEKWDDYIGKLQNARDVIGMTAAESAEYAAVQQGFTGLYAEQAGAVSGQTAALEDYRSAIQQGNDTEAAAHLERAQRYAEAEAMVLAQLANVGTLTDLLKGVQTELSATALSAALVVGGGAENVNALLAESLRVINERAAAIQRTTVVTAKNTAANREAEKAARAAELSAKQQADALRSIQHEMDPLTAEHDKYVERLGVLEQALSDNTLTEEEYGEAVRWNAEQYTRAATGADEYEKQTKSLISTYDRHNQRAAELQNALRDMGERYRAGVITGEQYVRMVAGVREEMRQLAIEADPLSKDLARSWEEAGNRIDQTFSDGFTGALDSFSDFEKQLLSGFKRLMGELLYQASLRPIVVGFTTDMRGAMSGGGIDLSNTIGAARGLMKGSSMFGGGAAAAGAGGLYANAATAGAGTLYGSAATGAAIGPAANAGIMSSISSGVSAAMPWVGAGLLADNVLGLGITNSITKAIGGLFGGKKRSHGEIGSESLDDPTGVLRYGSKYARESAIGAIGVTSKKRTDDDALISMVEQFVEIDNALAAVMTSAQLEKTRDAMDGWRSSNNENIGSIVDERLSAIFDATDSIFAEALAPLSGEKLIQGLVGGIQIENVGAQMATAVADDMNSAFRNALSSGSDVETASQVILSSAQAVQLLGDSVDRLNLQFDATASGALAAAGNLAQLAGGVENLATLQQSYYQNYFSDAERAAHLTDDVTQSLEALGMKMPETRAGFRALVEAQDQTTQAGSENYVQLLQLESAFAQLTPAVEGTGDALRMQSQLNKQLLQVQGDTGALRQLEIDALKEINGWQEAGLVNTQRQIWALEDYQAEQKEAERLQKERTRDIERETQAWARARDQLAGVGNSIDGWLAQLDGTEKGMGTPRERLEASDADFWSQYEKALQGDRNAQQGITQYADRYIANLQEMYASSAPAVNGIAEIRDAMERLPELLSPEQFLAEEFRGVIDGQTRALTNVLDLNGDGTVSAIERAISAEWGFTQKLNNVLHHEMRQLGTTVLTESQVRAALGPHATDAEISRLISHVDVNGDGMITRQELTNSRIGSLSSGIATSLAPLFDQIDIDGSGWIDYGEFSKTFAGVATDSTLNQIFNTLDADGDGVISRLEAINGGIDHLSVGIAASIAPLFDQIDLDNSGWIDYGEFSKAFAGVATDDELRRIFNKLDVDGNNQISRLEAINTNTSTIDQAKADGLKVSFGRNHNPSGLIDMAYNWGTKWGKMGAPAFRGTGGGGLDYEPPSGGGSKGGGSTGGGTSRTPRPFWERVASASMSATNREWMRHFKDGNRVTEAQRLIRDAGISVPAYATGAWDLPSDHLALLHKNEFIAPAAGGIADEFRAYAAGDYQAELLTEIGKLQPPSGPMHLPMPEMLPLPQLGSADVLQVLKDVRDELKESRKENKALHLERARLLEALGGSIEKHGTRSERQRERHLDELQAVNRNSKTRSKTV